MESSSSNCPTGFSPVGPNMTFPGLSDGPCVCTSSSANTTTQAACPDPSNIPSHCYQIEGLSSSSFDVFLDKKTCYARGGEASVLSYSPFVARPLPDANGQCASLNGVSYKQCGPGTYSNTNFPICWPASEQCPLVYMEASTSTLSSQTVTYGGAYGSDSTMTFTNSADLGSYSNGKNLYVINGSYVSSTNNVLPPIVDLQTSFANSGPCYDQTSPQDDYTSSQATWTTIDSSTTSAPVSLSNTQPGSCGTADTRYIKFAESSQANLLQQNFEKICTGLTTSGNKYDPFKYTCSGTPDSTGGGTSCCQNSNSNAPDYCLYYNDLNNKCRSGDTVCEKMTYMSKCGLYQMLIEKATNLQKVGTYFRTQIEWKKDCSVGKNEVENVVAPLDKTTSAQLGLVVINVLSGIFVGILFPCLIIYNIWYDDVPCVSGKGAEEKKRLKSYSSHTTLILNIVKMIPLLITIVLITKLTGTFTDLASQDCSDSVTNGTFDYLATTLPAVKSANMTTLGTDCVSLLLAIVAFVMHKCFPDSEDEGDGEKTTNNPTLELQNTQNAL